jgi:DNA-directed RNA polymerase specialized sigma24 family protein
MPGRWENAAWVRPGQWIFGCQRCKRAMCRPWASCTSGTGPACWLTRARLRSDTRASADEEDIVQAAFLSFHRAFCEGRVRNLSGPENLLALLMTIIARKAARKAPGPQHTGVEDLELLDKLSWHETESPVEQAILKDCYERYVGALPRDLRHIAEMCLTGITHREIAQSMSCAVRTVERKMERIIGLWRDLAATTAE